MKVTEILTHLSFAVVQDVIVLLLVGARDALEADEDGLNALDLDLSQSTHAFHGVHHVGDALKTFAEGIKLAKDVVLTVGRGKTNWLMT